MFDNTMLSVTTETAKMTINPTNCLEEAKRAFIAWLNETIGKERQQHLSALLRNTPGAMISGSSLMQFVHPSGKDWVPGDIDVFFDATKRGSASSQDLMMAFMRGMCMCGAHDSIHDYSSVGWVKGSPSLLTACFHYYQQEQEDIPKRYFRSTDTSSTRILRPFVSTATGCWGNCIKMNLIAVNSLETEGLSPGAIDDAMRTFIRADFAPKECAASYDGYSVHEAGLELQPNTVHMEVFRDWPLIASRAESITLMAYREAIDRWLQKSHHRHFLERIANYVDRGYTVVLTGYAGGATIVP